MARYKHIDTSPRFIAIDLARQLLPGTFSLSYDRSNIFIGSIVRRTNN
jgi:hypothetical protein